MRLHVPDHLQKWFQALMNLSYDLKKKRPDLKRNVKFDEDRLDMFMDIQIERDCLLYTSPSPRDRQKSRMPSSA